MDTDAKEFVKRGWQFATLLCKGMYKLSIPFYFNAI
jgi:hypothetical protein